MGDPDALLDAVRDKLRAIPAVVGMVGGVSANIASYHDDQPSWAEALTGMDEPAILLVLQESDFNEVGNAQFHYNVTGYFRLSGQRLGGAFKTICSGVPTTGDGQPFHSCEIHADFESIGLPQFRRDQDEDGQEYPAFAMRFRDRTNG